MDVCRDFRAYTDGQWDGLVVKSITKHQLHQQGLKVARRCDKERPTTAIGDGFNY